MSNRLNFRGEKPLLYLLLFTLFIPVCAFASPQSTKLETAKSLFHKGEYQQAKPLLLGLETCCEGEALYYLARTLEQEKSENRYTDAIQHHFAAAKLGSAPAMTSLANYYANGTGVQQDLLISTDWLRKATESERGNTTIHIVDLESGKAQDPVKIWKEKAEQGSVDALYRLARIYDEGVVIAQDLELAASYYLKAATSGHKQSEFMTGYFYCRGIGFSQNIDLANKWLATSQQNVICRPIKDEL